MTFIGGVILKDKMGEIPLTKGYIHSAGLDEIFSHQVIARNYLITQLSNMFLSHIFPEGINLSEADYIIGIAWGDIKKKEPVVDFFSYSDIKDWPGNPTVYNWVLRRNSYSTSKDITCGDGLILLGMEEELRRKNSRKEYEQSLVDLFELNRRISGKYI